MDAALVSSLKRFLIACAVLKIAVAAVASPALGASARMAARIFAPQWALMAIALSFGLVGSWLLMGLRRDESPAELGGLYLVIGASFSNTTLAQLALAPSAFVATMSRALHALPLDALMPWLLWQFVGKFPRPGAWELSARWCRWLSKAALATGIMLFATNFLAGLAPSTLQSSFGRLASFTSRDGIFFWIATYCLLIPALPLLVLKSHRAPRALRQRVNLFVLGLALGLAPLVLDGLLEALLPLYARFMSQPGVRRAAAWIVYPFILSIPFTTSYAVIVQHALDVRFIARRALQYALARYTIIALASTPIILWFVYIYQHRDQRISDMARGANALAMMAVFVSGGVALRVRRPVLAALDHRFFREQADAGEALVGFMETTRDARDQKELADRVADALDRVMHVDSIAMLISNPQTAWLESPNGGARPLRASSPLAGQALGARAPILLDWDADDARLGRLQDEDREWLADGGFHVLAALRGSGGEVFGLLALGEKRSDLPFSRMDLVLVEGVAASAGLAIENKLLRAPPLSSSGVRGANVATMVQAADAPAADECLACGRVQECGLQACGGCGGRLSTAMVPPLLRGKFQFERRVAAGGMGVVYQATDLSLGRAVAVKTLPRVSPSASIRLRREARAIAAVSHPNLATIFGVESWRGTPLLMLEFLEGGTLKTRLLRGPIPAQEVIDLGITLGSVLGRVHAVGILHRDVKPSNIGYTADGVPKLLDFGLARLLSDPEDSTEPARAANSRSRTRESSVLTFSDFRSIAGRIVGTIAYLSPEAAMGNAPDPSCDLWGLAVVLYEAAAGSHPFLAGDTRTTLARITGKPVRDLRETRPEAPAGLAEFLSAALSLDRRRRPPTADAFVTRLEQIRRSDGGSGPPVTPRRQGSSGRDLQAMLAEPR